MLQCLSTIGASRTDIENWLVRLELRTTYDKTTRGSARKFSLENVLELALVSAYSRSGAPLQVTVAMADAEIRAVRHNQKVWEWAAFAAGNYAQGRKADHLQDFDTDALIKLQPEGIPALIFVQVGQVVRQVRALFAEGKDD